MHSFQEMPIHYFEKNPFEAIGKDWMLITAEKDNKVNTMTASWGGMGVMWGKNVAFIAVRNSRYTKEFLDASDTFSLSFFNPEEKGVRAMLMYLGTASGRKEDKIKSAKLKVNLHVNEDKQETPYIDNANLIFICRKMFAQELSKDHFLIPEIEQKFYKDNDYHVLYIAEILTMMAR